MANFINSIKVGTTTYSIGMENAIHFDGLSVISTWFSDSACKTAATVADLGNDFLYYNKAAIGDAVVTKGCMYIPTSDDAGTATGYELVCVDLKDGISKWAILGEVKKETKSVVTGITTAAKQVVAGVTADKGSVIGTITPATASIADGVVTASYNVITAAPTLANVTAQEAVGNVTPSVATINYGSAISAGNAEAQHVTTAAPLSATVSGGLVSAAKGSLSVSYNEASATADTVAVNLTSTDKTVATALTSSAGQITKTEGKIQVVGNTLELPVDFIKSLTVPTSVITAVAASTASVAVPSAAALATKVVTGVAITPVTHTVSGVVTGVTYTAPTVTLPTAVVTGISYTAPTLTTKAQALVSAVSTDAVTFGTVATDASLIASVPYAEKTVATAAGAAKPVVTGIAAGAVSAITGVTVTTANVNEVTAVTSGTVVTAVL